MRSKALASIDNWSVAAQTCLATAKTAENLHACSYKHLTQEQQDKLDRAASAVVAGKGPPDRRDNHDTKLKITGIDPEKGDVEGGTYVRIIGNRFTADGPRSTKVYFGSQQGTVVRFTSDSEIIVQAPGGKLNETVDVLVIFDPGGVLKIPSSFTFVEKR